MGSPCLDLRVRTRSLHSPEGISQGWGQMGSTKLKPIPSRSSPEHHAVPVWMRCHAVRDVVVDLHVLVQGFHHFALQQVLVPEVTLPKHSVQHCGRRGLDVRGDLPQAQRVPVPDLIGRGKG